MAQWGAVALGSLRPNHAPFHGPVLTDCLLRLTEHLDLPAESYYEWWIFEDARTAERFPVYDYFVNHGTWTLRSAEEIESSYDPTWERGRLEWLRPLQELFWKMVGEYRPLAYVAVGAQLTITSRDHTFLDAVSRHSDAGSRCSPAAAERARLDVQENTNGEESSDGSSRAR